VTAVQQMGVLNTGMEIYKTRITIRPTLLL